MFSKIFIALQTEHLEIIELFYSGKFYEKRKSPGLIAPNKAFLCIEGFNNTP